MSLVLPSTGWYCAAVIADGIVKHRFTDDLQELTEVCGVESARGADVYMALASFRTKERKQEAVIGIKSLWLDIDCGKDKAATGKGYYDHREAVEALGLFCAALGLPDPLINNSGRGLHVYWPLTETVPAADWLPVAKALKAACKEYGLIADAAVTADTARILRPPKTCNYKDKAHPLSVRVISEGAPSTFAELRAALAQYAKPAAPAGIAGLVPPTFTVEMDEATKALINSRQSYFKEIVTRSLRGKGCAQISYIVSKQEEVEEPLWRAGLSIAWACEDKDTAIHKMSSKHPDYTPENTLAKARMTKGPYRCEWFKENYGARCEKCKLKLSSPILLSKHYKELETAEEPEAPLVVDTGLPPLLDPGFDVVAAMDQGVATLLPGYEPVRQEETVQFESDQNGDNARPKYTPPFPYYRGKEGGIFRKAVSEDEDDKRIFEHDLFPTKLIDDPSAGYSVELNLYTKQHGLRRFIAPFSDLSAPDKCRLLLSKNGVIASQHAMVDIMNYQIAYVQDIFKNKNADTARTQFGWADKDTRFIIGTREVQPKRIVYSPPSSSTAEAVGFYSTAGNLKDWKRAFNLFVGSTTAKQAFALMSAFGAPLMKYTGSNGASISLVSNQSGTGKTTILHLINSVWGHPRDCMLQKDDTFMSKIHRIGVLNNLPVTVDEVTNMDLADVSELLYTVTSGRGRNRMEAASNKERANTTRWSTMSITTGNAFLTDKLAALKATSDGEQMRLIEIEIPVLEENPQAEELIRIISDNYGLAGEVYAQYLITHREEITRHIDKLRRKFIADIKGERKERFWINGAVANIVGGIIAQRLGLHDYDMRAIYRFCVEYFGNMRQVVRGHITDSVDVLGEFINNNLNYYLIYDGTKTNPLTGTHVVKPAVGKVLARYDKDLNLLYVSKTEFRKYCVEKQVSLQNALNEFCTDFEYAGTMKKRLAAGTGISSPAVDVYKFKCLIELDAGESEGNDGV